jgi:hypothetical protein
MRGVFFLSHQWTAFNRPDHSTLQLRTVQQLLERAIQGKLSHTAPAFIGTLRFSSKVKVTSREWKELVPHAFIWLDYISVRKAAGDAIALTVECACDEYSHSGTKISVTDRPCDVWGQ